MDLHKGDTTSQDGRQEKNEKKRAETELKAKTKNKRKTKPAFLCPADGARTTQERKAETKGQKKNSIK